MEHSNLAELMERQRVIANKLCEPLPIQLRADLELELKWITYDIERLQYLKIQPWIP